MEFTSAAMLRALPVAAIPVIIYLLFRWRRREIEWGSMYVLRRVLETKSRLRAWLQYLVVALRTLALAAVVVAVAGPTGRKVPVRADAFPSPPPATHRVVLLDTSASMAARHEASTRLEAALGLCRTMLRSGISPGRLDIVPLAGGHEPITFDAFPVTATRIEEALSAVAVPQGVADLAAGLRQTEKLFHATASDRRELLVVSDFALVNFADSAATAEVAATLARLKGEGIAIHALRTQSADTRNFTLLEFTPHADTLLAGQQTLFHATVGFSGNAAEGETVLTIEADPDTPRARVLQEKPLSMTRGETEVDLTVALPAGRHALRASLRPDDLPADDAQTRVFTAAGSVRVIFVQDLDTGRGFDDPRTWLDIALANAGPTGPGAAGDGAAKAGAAADGGDTTARALTEAATKLKRDEFAAGDAAAAGLRIDLEGKIPEQVNPALLEGVDLLILSGVGRIEPAVVEAIRRHASRGGMVLLAPKPEQKVADFNAAWAAIAPARLDAARWNAVDPERYESCAAESLSSPLWRELESTEHGNLANARFYNHFTLEPDSLVDSSEVILSVGDGGPLLLERRIGRGGVMLWTAGLTHQWHSLVVHPGFPVMLMRLVGLAADRLRFETNVALGEPLVMPTAVPEAKVIRPDGSSELVATVARGEARFVRYARTDLPGTYDIREDVASDLPGVLFTVSADVRSESDLAAATAEIEARLEAAAGEEWCDSGAAVAAKTAAGYPGPSWALPVALAMLAALVGEAAISRWFLS
jgi:hypothetical protein